MCDDGWDLADGHVVCKQLGFPGAIRALLGEEVPTGSGKIWLDHVGCTGNEIQLSNCILGDWEPHTCNHFEDAGVICKKGKCDTCKD